MRNKKRSKGLTALGAAAVAAMMVLAGCSSSDEDGSSTAEPSANEEMATQASAAATVGELSLTGVWAKESSLDLAAAFGMVSNGGDTDDALISVEAVGVPRVELHETVDGVMKQVEAFVVPAGGTMTLEPGASHIMFLDLTEKLSPGDTVEMTWNFESGESVEVEAPVRAFSSEHMAEMGTDMNSDG